MNITPLIIGFILIAVMMTLVGNTIVETVENYNITNSTPYTTYQVYNETINKTSVDMQKIENRTVGFYRKSFLDASKYTDAIMAFVDVGAVIVEMPGTVIDTYLGNLLGKDMKWVPDIIKLAIPVIIIVIFVMRVAAIFAKTEEI